MKHRKIKPGLYRNFNGGMYRVLANATHTETGEKLVIYQDETSGKVWARPYEMFAALVDREQFAREEGSMDDLEALCIGCPVNKLVELGVYDENR